MTTRRVNMPVLVAGLALIVPMIVLFAISFGNNPNARPSALVGTRATDFSLVDLDGNAVSLGELAGKPVVLNFWSTWCGPCKFEHPVLQQAAKANPDVAFYGVIYSDDPQKARMYLQRAGTTYPHLVDTDNRVAIDYGVTGVPESFFIDRQGTIVYKFVGPLEPQQLAQLLAMVRR